jgi:hypothetical protein
MNAARSLLSTLPLACALALTACGQAPQNANDSIVKQALDEAKAGIDQARVGMNDARAEIEKARETLGKENLSIGDGDKNLPKAEITPQGDLLIGGTKVDVNEQQHALLETYRAQLLAVAQSGMDVGVQGADIGLKAAGEALKGVFNGDTKQIEAKIAPQVEKLKIEALALCNHLPGLLDAQTKLAAALPAFKPYATMSISDIDDCKKDVSDTSNSST